MEPQIRTRHRIIQCLHCLSWTSQPNNFPDHKLFITSRQLFPWGVKLSFQNWNVAHTKPILIIKHYQRRQLSLWWFFLFSSVSYVHFMEAFISIRRRYEFVFRACEMFTFSNETRELWPGFCCVCEVLLSFLPWTNDNNLKDFREILRFFRA